jgi:hypothetical protein
MGKETARTPEAPEITQTSGPGERENHEKYLADDSAAIRTFWWESLRSEGQLEVVDNPVDHGIIGEESNYLYGRFIRSTTSLTIGRKNP